MVVDRACCVGLQYESKMRLVVCVEFGWTLLGQSVRSCVRAANNAAAEGGQAGGRKYQRRSRGVPSAPERVRQSKSSECERCEVCSRSRETRMKVRRDETVM